MKKVENECIGCPTEIGCFGSSCKYSNVIRYYCDFCKEETKLYEYNGYEICEECLLKEYSVVEGSNDY